MQYNNGAVKPTGPARRSIAPDNPPFSQHTHHELSHNSHHYPLWITENKELVHSRSRNYFGVGKVHNGATEPFHMGEHACDWSAHCHTVNKNKTWKEAKLRGHKYHNQLFTYWRVVTGCHGGASEIEAKVRSFLFIAA